MSKLKAFNITSVPGCQLKLKSLLKFSSVSIIVSKVSPIFIVEKSCILPLEEFIKVCGLAAILAIFIKPTLANVGSLK